MRTSFATSTAITQRHLRAGEVITGTQPGPPRPRATRRGRYRRVPERRGLFGWRAGTG